MSDRYFVRAAPISQAEQAARRNHSTTINVSASAERMELRREWVRDNASAEAGYGYAEAYTAVRNSESKFELTVPTQLDTIALTAAILSEINRQMIEAEVRAQSSKREAVTV